MFCREWNEGLLTTLLRKLCIPALSTSDDSKTQRVMKILQLDGEASADEHYASKPLLLFRRDFLQTGNAISECCVEIS